MKKTKKILVALLMLALIISSLTFVNAGMFSEDGVLNNVTISDGVREGNKVTFDINLPSETGMRGDVMDEAAGCVVNTNDSALLLNYVSMFIDATQIDLLKADFNGDGTVDVGDLVRLNMAILGTPGDLTDEQLKEIEEKGYLNDAEAINMDSLVIKKPVILNGTLASNSTAKIVQSNGKYKIEVTIPDGTTDGTIGVTLVQSVFISNERKANNERKVNGFESSKLLNISTGTNSPKPINTVTISDGEKSDNKVLFKINLGKETELRGDVNSDGKVDSNDVVLVEKKVTNQPADISEIAADVNGDGEINRFDITIIKDIIKYNSDSDKTNDTVTLTGDLKDKASAKLVKGADGNFVIEVSVPEDIAEGKIGVTLAEGAFINAEKAKSEKVSSKEFSYTNPNAVKEPDSTDKDKTPSKDDVKDETPSKDDGKDDTTSNTKIPQTGVTNVMLVVIAGVAIVGTVVFIRSRKMLK